MNIKDPITLRELADVLEDLSSEDGENPEYDRALIEVMMRVGGFNEDDRQILSDLILKSSYLNKYINKEEEEYG